MLTLQKARHLAMVSPISWCIVPYGCGYAIAKQTAHAQWDLYHLVDENNEPLRFKDIDAARYFLRTQLHISQAKVLLAAVLDRVWQ